MCFIFLFVICNCTILIAKEEACVMKSWINPLFVMLRMLVAYEILHCLSNEF